MSKIAPLSSKDLKEFGIGTSQQNVLKEDTSTTSVTKDNSDSVKVIANVQTPLPSPITSRVQSVLAPSQLEATIEAVQQALYPGDVTDTNGPLRNEYISIDENQTINFPSPLHMGMVIVPWLRDGTITPYGWQIEQLEEIGRESDATTLHHPYKLALCAANGSGKDAIIVALTVVWYALKYRRSLQIITSSSGTQLTAQTETYIKNIAEHVNSFFGEQFFRIRQRFIKCNLSGSEIRLFATDEKGKAEGYHPLEPNAKFAIWVNEAKSVSEDIFEALRRCTGYTHWFNVSTPAGPTGAFYRSFRNGLSGVANWKWRRVTSYDCPSHLSEGDRDEDRRELGEDSALYRSKHLALFTSEDGEVVITLSLLEKARKLKIPHKCTRWEDRVGIDLAAGGDENSIKIAKGNKIRSNLEFREKDTTVTADRIDRWLTQEGISKDSEFIFADDGGVGHAIIDMLVKLGWKIKRVNNQSPALNKTRFGNRGAENWYRIRRFFEAGFLIPPDEPKLINQLTNRYFKQSGERQRIYLQSKAEAKAEGNPSPDRADSYVLCYSGLTFDDFQQEFTSVKVDPVTARGALSANEFYNKYITDQVFGQQDNSGNKIPPTTLQELIRN